MMLGVPLRCHGRGHWGTPRDPPDLSGGSTTRHRSGTPNILRSFASRDACGIRKGPIPVTEQPSARNPGGECNARGFAPRDDRAVDEADRTVSHLTCRFDRAARRHPYARGRATTNPARHAGMSTKASTGRPPPAREVAALCRGVRHLPSWRAHCAEIGASRGAIARPSLPSGGSPSGTLRDPQGPSAIVALKINNRDARGRIANTATTSSGCR